MGNFGKSGVGVGKIWKVVVGVGHFTSDSTSLTVTELFLAVKTLKTRKATSCGGPDLKCSLHLTDKFICLLVFIKKHGAQGEHRKLATHTHESRQARMQGLPWHLLSSASL